MYFTALLARTDDGWEASDTEFDDVESLDELADLAREAAPDDTVLVCIEQEGVWFGIVRIDGEDDPRVFVSDAARAMRSAYGEILLTDELLGREAAEADLLALDDLDVPADDEVGAGQDADGAGGALDHDTDNDTDDETDTETDDTDDDTDPDEVPRGPVGDAALLADLGIDAGTVLKLSPDDALGEIAETLGAADVLEAVR